MRVPVLLQADRHRDGFPERLRLAAEPWRNAAVQSCCVMGRGGPPPCGTARADTLGAMVGLAPGLFAGRDHRFVFPSIDPARPRAGIARPASPILPLRFHFDAATGRHTLAVGRVLRCRRRHGGAGHTLLLRQEQRPAIDRDTLAVMHHHLAVRVHRHRRRVA